jgi:cell division septation protein DedD
MSGTRDPVSVLRSQEVVMKAASTIGTICMILLVWGGGCSKEEQPAQPVKRTKVVKPIKKSIKRPPIKKAKVTSASKDVKVRPKQIKTVQAKPKKKKQIETKPKQKPASKIKTAAIKETTKKTVVKKKEPKKKEGVRYYTVKKSDSLSSIAGRRDVYGDALKWPNLYRLNMDKLAGIKIAEDLPDRKLDAGMRLKITTPNELKKIQKRHADHMWVINILSVSNEREIIPQVVRLIREGYPVYFTRVNVKGKDWKRLRLGFYKSKKEADTEGKKVMALLKLVDSWSVKIGEKEFAEYCGF